MGLGGGQGGEVGGCCKGEGGVSVGLLGGTDCEGFEGREVGRGRTFVVGQRAPGEYLEEGEVAGVFGGGLESLDVGRLEQLGEDEGVGGGGGLGY